MHQAQATGSTSLPDTSCALDIKPTIQNGNSSSLHNGGGQSSAPKQREGTNATNNSSSANTNTNSNSNTTNHNQTQNSSSSGSRSSASHNAISAPSNHSNHSSHHSSSLLNGSSAGLFDGTAQTQYGSMAVGLCNGVAGNTSANSYDSSYASYAAHHHAAQHQAAAAAAAGMFQSSSMAAAAAARHHHHGMGSSGAGSSGMSGVGGSHGMSGSLTGNANNSGSSGDAKPSRTKPRTSAGKQDNISTHTHIHAQCYWCG